VGQASSLPYKKSRENRLMRTILLAFTALCLLGCARVDPGSPNTAVPPDSPTVTRPDDPARPAATPAETTPRDPAVAQGEARPTEPDNTGINTRDANRTTRDPKLPIDQKENQADVDITAKIRSRVVGTDGLSINARNIKIITADGKVTLRGPVESAAERDRIAAIAREVAGAGNVDDQIDVKGASSSPPASAPPASTPPASAPPASAPPASAPPATPNP
jgi:hyperosmotically inducible protein